VVGLSCPLGLIGEEVHCITVQIEVLGHTTVVNHLRRIAEIGHDSVIIFLAELGAGHITGLFECVSVHQTLFGGVSPRQLFVNAAPLVPKLGPNVLLANLPQFVLSRAI
jgi:hypothetical protein